MTPNHPQEDEASSIKAYEGFYNELNEVCNSIDHPYNSQRIPRSTAILYIVKIENLQDLKKRINQIAENNNLKFDRLLLIRVEKKDYKLEFL
ncbi:hypothetical protein Lepto782_12425 [Leptospira interrogans serovar Canicola]|uniref:Uncharacterized protein n=3 Tax=Leptospira interrogans TaxID=173 RepID=A0AAQ0AY66_LEPIR|nr:hypothetical protein [Leptospira interrogans]EKO26273.1 hypothetical protein LEP1GSC104_3189 [Leptospira interrogans str. UI 12621]MBM2888896.1 hypothetical protein [Leptospira interrogans]QOI42982.1 hypothetical protein Lepto782_12425 [Leptospira interrogans serovar Canicola]QOI52413.1 hypothetical protein Lepto1489_19750 [Leptospira interrogans serovar Bataviae]